MCIQKLNIDNKSTKDKEQMRLNCYEVVTLCINQFNINFKQTMKISECTLYSQVALIYILYIYIKLKHDGSSKYNMIHTYTHTYICIYIQREKSRGESQDQYGRGVESRVHRNIENTSSSGTIHTEQLLSANRRSPIKCKTERNHKNHMNISSCTALSLGHRLQPNSFFFLLSYLVMGRCVIFYPILIKNEGKI